MRALSDAGLTSQTARLRARRASGESLDALLPEAFASVRQAAVRSIGQRPFDVQVMGAAALHAGKVAEMRTGEGKTLAATLPAYLNALDGGAVHVLTANEYLAVRDAAWMTPVYQALGLNVGCLLAASPKPDRAQAYLADVTYGVASEFAYDYLRDHLARKLGDRVQRGLRYAIVDEADLIMIDDARSVPQIMSGQGSADSPDLPYRKLAAIAASLRSGTDYTITPRGNEIALTDQGAQAAERQLGVGNLYDAASMPLAHGLQKALEAAFLYRRDRDYMVSGGEVLFIGPTSGRPERRKFSDGLQEALEAKEGVEVQRPATTLAAIPTNEYLKEYERLAAMTGTAASDAASYQAIYGLDVVVIPTARPMIRVDQAGVFYATAEDKLRALVRQTAKRHATGQPVLIGSGSIEQAERISAMLTSAGIGHQLLTAKNNEREAEVIEGSGSLGAVTVIARMAGRGVDIVLGGPDATANERNEVADRGGLCMLGSERFTSKRLETHLRGRAGRQGDPGESDFFASFEDDAVRALLGTASAARSRKWLAGAGGMRSQVASRSFDSAQAQFTANAAEQVRAELEFDAVLAEQRREIYAIRDEILTAADLSGRMKGLISERAAGIVAAADPRDVADLRRCKEMLLRLYPTGLSTSAIARAAAGLARRDGDPVGDAIRTDVERAYALREAEIGPATMRELERAVSLEAIDRCWPEHLGEMFALLDGIGLRAVGGRSPLAEYRREARVLMGQMLGQIERISPELLFSVGNRPKRAQRGTRVPRPKSRA